MVEQSDEDEADGKHVYWRPVLHLLKEFRSHVARSTTHRGEHGSVDHRLRVHHLRETKVCDLYDGFSALYLQSMLDMQKKRVKSKGVRYNVPMNIRHTQLILSTSSSDDHKNKSWNTHNSRGTNATCNQYGGIRRS